MHTDVAIIGAGLAGFSAARELRRAGLSVAIVDKGRGVGGRLATRRMGDARLDHGAQFFTVRGDAFRSVIDRALADGIVEVWCHGFTKDDGYPRYACPGGMTALAKWLAADLSITLSSRIVNLSRQDDHWAMSDEDKQTWTAEHVIVTAPVPQIRDLLNVSGLALEPKHEAALADIAYKPVIGLLVTLDGPSAVPEPGAVQATEDDTFTFIADNQAKGVSPVPALTFHCNGELSAQRWDDPEVEVLADLILEASPWIGDASVLEMQLKKWRYAGPLSPYPERSLTIFEEPGLVVLAGDAFGGPKVEGAFNSGQAAAQIITSFVHQ